MSRTADEPKSNSTVGAGGDSSAPVVVITVEEALSVPVTLLLGVFLVVEAEDDFSAPLVAIPVEEIGDCVPFGVVWVVVVVVPFTSVVLAVVLSIELFDIPGTWKLALTVRL